jgi:hypothetical protein
MHTLCDFTYSESRKSRKNTSYRLDQKVKMEKLRNYTNVNYEEIKKQFGNLKTMNPLSSHVREEVEKEVDFTRSEMAEVKNQVAEYDLPHNPERTAIYNKLETILTQMKVKPRPPTYWNRTKEEALSYHLHTSRSTAETLRSLVKDLWNTVKADKIEKDLKDYRRKKLLYMNKKGEDMKEEEMKEEDAKEVKGREEKVEERSKVQGRGSLLSSTLTRDERTGVDFGDRLD